MKARHKIERVVRDGKVAVLVSPGYGAGWSTWSSEHAEFLLFDAGLVALAERGASEDEVKGYINTVLGKELDHTGNECCKVYTGGWDDVEINWVPVGEAFRIDEYDGYEELVIHSMDHNIFIA